MLRPLYILLFITLLLPNLTHAGWIETKNDRTILHIRLHDWIFPDPVDTTTSTRANAAAVKAFIKQFPQRFQTHYKKKYLADPDTYGNHNWDNIQIQVHNFSGIKVEGVESDLLAIAGKVAPDIIYVNFRRSDTYIQNNFLYPLDKPQDHYITSLTKEELDFRINKKIWPVIQRKGPHGKQHVWALPYGGALGRVTLFRKDLFDEANIPHPHINWTWDDFYNACKNIADPAKGIYAIQYGRGKHESWYWTSYLWSMGGEVMEYDPPTDTWTISFDSPQGARALDFYTKIKTEPWTDTQGKKRYGYAYQDSSDAYHKWTRGEIAMANGYIDEKMFASINPDITGMVPLPIGPTGLRAGELNSRMMALFSEIKDPAIRDAAWEFIRYYDSKEALRIKTRILVEGGLGRFVNPRYLRLFGYQELIRLAPKTWEQTFNIAINTGKPEPYGRHSNIAYDIMTEPLQQAQALALAGKLPTNQTERLTLLHTLLQKAGDKARHKMLGKTPPHLLKKQRASALLFLLAILSVFTLLFRNVAKAFTPTDHTGKNKNWQWRKYKTAYLILLPAALTILFWQYTPLLRGSIMAFQNYALLGPSTWVGLDNFGAVLWDPDWWQSVWNALRYSALVMALTFLPPIILAILLQEIPHGKTLFRTIYYLPAVISGLVVILLWKSFYDPSEAGALNALLMRLPAWTYLTLGALLAALSFTFAKRLRYHDANLISIAFTLTGLLLFAACWGLAAPALHRQDIPLPMRLFTTLPEPYRWLSDPRSAMIACVIPMVWAGIGPGCLIYLAALKGIANDYYEAADIDGATFIDKILLIVFPLLKPLILINFIGVFIGSWFGATANILAMTGGASNTEVAGLRIFYEAFVYLKFGPATAMAWILGFILIGFTVHQLRILSRLEFKTTGDD